MMEASMIKNMIQCPFCFIISTNMKFFSCKNSHKICEHCFNQIKPLGPTNRKTPARQKCPQGDCLYSNPPFRNVEIEEMIRNYELEVNCKYYHDGCQVLDLRAAMAEHEGKCGCREVTCPNSECDTRLQVRQIFNHIKETHKDAVVREDKESSDFSLTCLLKNNFQEREASAWITIIWNHKNGQSFFPIFEKRNRSWFAWIFILGNEEEAARWESSIKIRDAENKSQLEFCGPVFPIDMKGTEVMEKMKCLALSDKQVDMMKSEEGIQDEEMERGFNSKIIITYDVKLIKDEGF
eukprot:GFUD01014903.1.p1 GENE.GFUD01014903.1~~GFUD01014903.1.p1  ORF type:complete len:294 (+),score=85.27 GFUD01014903.1:178-1059(+)